jgi:DNA-binding beta-propeller fold protein YncE
LALENSGQSVIVGSFSNEVVRINLTTKAVTTVGNTGGPAYHVAVEPGNQSILVAEPNRGLSRIDIVNHHVTELFADPTVSGKVVIESGGGTALLTTQEGIKHLRIR